MFFKLYKNIKTFSTFMTKTLSVKNAKNGKAVNLPVNHKTVFRTVLQNEATYQDLAAAKN